MNTPCKKLLFICLLGCVLCGQPVFADDAADLQAINRILNEADSDNAIALRHMEALRTAQTNATGKAVRLQTLRALVNLYYDAGEIKRSDSVRDELAALATELNSPEDVALTDIMKSYRLLDEGQSDEAMQRLRVLQDKMPADASAELRMRLNSALGQAYYVTGNFDSSLHCYLEALRLTDFLTTRRIQQRIDKLDAIAQLYGMMKDPEKSLATVKEAMELSPLARQPKAYASLSLNEGMAYSDLKMPKEAFDAYQRALKTARAAGAQVLELVALIDITDYYLTVFEYKNADEYARASMKRAEELGDTQSYMTAKVNLGFALAGQGKITAGVAYIDEMVKYLLKADRKLDVEAILRDETDMYERAGMYKEALATLRQQQKLSNELFRSDRTKAVAALQEQFNAEQRQKQIELLARENQLKDAEIRNHALQMIVVMLGVVVTIMGGVFIYLLYRRVKRVNQQLMEANSQLEFHAVRDPLTGLFNRRSFVDMMNTRREQNYPERREQELNYPDSLILLDIDHFKQINDTLGHAAGDTVLVEIAQRLRSAVRESDKVLRWGGEEFLVYAPRSHPAQIVGLVERVLNAVGETPVHLGERSVQVTMTAGFIALPYSGVQEHIFDWEKALQIADMALYLGKANGRNRAYGLSDLKVQPDIALPVLEQDLTAAIAAGMVDLLEVMGPPKLDTAVLRYSDAPAAPSN